MTSISQFPQPCQEHVHFFHLDHNTYYAFITSPGIPTQAFAQAQSFIPDDCFHIRSALDTKPPPLGSIPTDSLDIPHGNTSIYLLPGIFKIAPSLKDQARSLSVIHNTDIWPGHRYMKDIAMIVITHPWPPQDQQSQPSPLPEKKPPHLHIVRHKTPPKLHKTKHNRPSRYLIHYFSQIPTRLSWQPVLKAMYKQSLYIDRTRLTHFRDKRPHKGRFYLKGNTFLATALGISPKSLNRTLSWMKKHRIIKLRHRGYPGEGNSIWELPFSMAHSFAWLREPPPKKTDLQ